MGLKWDLIPYKSFIWNLVSGEAYRARLSGRGTVAWEPPEL